MKFKYKMSYFFYNATLWFAYPFFQLVCHLSLKMRSTLDTRRVAFQTFLSQALPPHSEVFWFHSASVGELDQSRAIMTEFRKLKPQAVLLQSTMSNSVQERHLQSPVWDYHFPLPMDTVGAYEELLLKFKPKLLCILAWDTWPNLILACHNHKVRIVLACAILHSKSGRLHFPMRGITNASFSLLNAVFTSQESMNPLFQTVLPDSVKLQALGDSRFDSVMLKLESATRPDSFTQFSSWMQQRSKTKDILILASTYNICESVILPSFQKKDFSDRFEVWIFPHKLSPERLTSVQKKIHDIFQIQATLYSEIVSPSSTHSTSPFVLFDELGILAFAYQYASFTYVGGALQHRIHNTIEPASFGLPILSGPLMEHAPEAIALKEAGGLQTFTNSQEFEDALQLWLQNPNAVEKIRLANKSFVQNNRGANLRIAKALLQI